MKIYEEQIKTPANFTLKLENVDSKLTEKEIIRIFEKRALFGRTVKILKVSYAYKINNYIQNIQKKMNLVHKIFYA